MRFSADLSSGPAPRPPGPAGAGLALVLGLWIAVAAFHPFTPALPQFGLDASWVATMGEAADRGLRWGPDVAFTYGPASALVTGYFNAAYLTVTLPLLLATTLLLGSCTVLLVTPWEWPAAAVTAVAVGLIAAFSAGYPDSLFLVLPLLPFLLALARERPGPARSGIAAATAVAVGMIGMAKMSFPLSALPLFLLGDAAAARYRRLPVLTPLCLFGFLLSYGLYGQAPSDLPLFVRQQWEVVAGYSDAMAVDGSRVELLAFVLAAALLVALTGLAGRRVEPPRFGLAVPLGLAWVLLLLFKAGFVRQDTHTSIAWFGPALVAALVAGGRLRPVAPRPALGLALAGVAGAVLLGPGPARVLVADPAAEAAAALRLFGDPAGFAAGLRAAKAGRWRALAEAAPLPRLAGGVDVIPSRQSLVLAHGLAYRARPSFQEYSTYTPALIAANRAFLAGPTAPRWVLFGPESSLGAMTIDRRYPNLAEGGLWIDLLRLYRPERRIDDLLALERRDTPAPVVLGPAQHLEVGFDAVVPVDLLPGGSGTRAVVAAIDVRPTLLGRLVAFLYKPPPLTIDVRFADGHAQAYRIMSGLASSGFVLSPLVNNASEFEALADGTPPAPARVVTGFCIHAPPRLRALFAPRFAVDLRPVSGGTAAPRPAPASAWAALAVARGLDATAGDVSAAPPSTLSVPVAGLARVDLGFGLALADEAPPGAERLCFALVPVDGGGQPLWRRCLDRAVAADRAPQTLSVALPPGTAELALVTTCATECQEGVEGYWARP